MFKKIIKNTTILSIGTLSSRILGFIRDILIAKFFGTSATLEAFLVAFRLPNIFRSMFAEGFSDSVATPVLSEYQKDKKKIFEIGSNLISFFAVVIFILTVLGIIFVKFFVSIIAPGFIGDVLKFNLSVSFARVTFIYLFLICISSSLISILYSLKKFFIPAINPVFLNISFIVGILFFSKYLNNSILVVCVLIGGILQIVFPFIALKKEGFALRFNFLRALRDSTVLKMLKLFVPRIWASVVYHLSVVIDTVFSSLSFIVGQGALASIYYANRIIQFPFALIALSVSRVAIVDLSSYHKQGNIEEFKKLFIFSFQNIVFFIIPVAAMLIFNSLGIIDVLFVRGKFDVSSLSMTSNVLFFYSFGLFFFCGIKLLVHSFYSLKDTKTPAKTATIALIANIILSAFLMFPLKIGGVALGSSLAAALNFFFLYRCLIKRIGVIRWEDTKEQFIKILLLSIVSAATSRFVWNILMFNKYMKMGISVIAFFVLFTLLGSLLKIKQITYFRQWLLKKI